MSFAMGRRSSAKGPRGIMSGSRKRFRRNGSTASSESGPPSWNRTIPTLFFPAKAICPGSTNFSGARSLRAAHSCAGRQRHSKERKWPSRPDMPRERYPGFSLDLRLSSQFFHTRAQRFQFVPPVQQQDEERRERRPNQQVRNAHSRIKPRPGTAQNHRLRMLSPPPANRKIHQWHVEEGKDSKERAKKRTLVRLFKHRAQEQIGNVEQPENESERQARVPGPPDTPYGVRPDRPGDKYHGDEGKPHFRRRHSEPVPFRLPLEDVHQIRVKADSECNEGTESAGKVQIEYFLDDSHGLLDGRVMESQVSGKRDQHKQDGCAEDGLQHRELPPRGTLPRRLNRIVFIPPRDIRRKAIAPSKRRCRKLSGFRDPPAAAPDWAQEARRWPPCSQSKQE